MLKNTYPYENRMFKNIEKCSIISGGKGKVRGTVIKSLINARVEEGFEGRNIKD
jgi:hypothetical protein